MKKYYKVQLERKTVDTLEMGVFGESEEDAKALALEHCESDEYWGGSWVPSEQAEAPTVTSIKVDK